jgi:beta-N-acetylhexosaminidase
VRLSRDPAARRRLAALAGAAAIALVAGALLGSGNRDGAAGGGTERSGESPAARLNLRRQVGQLLVSSFDGTRLPPYMRRRLRAGETAGVILFGRNAGSEAGLRQLTGAVRRAAGGVALVAVDQEGGLVRSVPFAGPLPGQAEQEDPGEAERLARDAAGELRALGVNVNLAPVADVPAGPAAVLAGRSFQGTPPEVSELVAAATRGMRAARVAATAKHFPGLGAASANTDDAPVTIEGDRAELEARDLPPFEAAVEQGTPLVMASHALYPAYDGREIASQSAAVLVRLLRRRLGFRGVIVTDSMEAEAVLARSGLGEAAERSLAAGADLLLLTGSGSWNEVFPRLLARARASPQFRVRVGRSAERVLALKRRLARRPGTPPLGGDPVLLTAKDQPVRPRRARARAP